MAEFTEDDVARLAAVLDGCLYYNSRAVAYYLLDKGVKMPPPPPDPAVVVARVLAGAATPGLGWGPVDLYPVHADLLALVRDLFPPDALKAAAIKAAAAKVQEAEG